MKKVLAGKSISTKMSETSQDPYFKNNGEAETTTDKEVAQDWMDEDLSGQLSVDVYQTKDDIVIKSTIAGVKPEDIDISINNDMVTVRGIRKKDNEIPDEDYFYRECYWGGFSRSIILPCEIKADKVEAIIKNGVLTIIMPKAAKVSKVKVIKVKEEG
jgi:HSP20 family protein